MNPLQQSPTKLQICSPLHIYAHLQNIYIHPKISKPQTVNPGHAHSNAYSHWQPQPGRVGRENLQSYICFWLYPLLGRVHPPQQQQKMYLLKLGDRRGENHQLLSHTCSLVYDCKTLSDYSKCLTTIKM